MVAPAKGRTVGPAVTARTWLRARLVQVAGLAGVDRTPGAGPNGRLYGGGGGNGESAVAGGNGAQGVIVLTYTPAASGGATSATCLGIGIGVSFAA